MSVGFKKHAKQLGYCGDLIRPIAKSDPKRTVRPLGLLNLNVEIPGEKQWVKDEHIRKLSLLFDHYQLEGLDIDSVLQLAYLLAMHWIPGFEVVQDPPRKIGAPPKSKREELDRLVSEIDKRLASKEVVTLKSACKDFLDVNRSERRWKNITPRRLENIYRETKASHDKQMKLRKALLEMAPVGRFGLIGGNFSRGTHASAGNTLGGLFELGQSLTKKQE